MNTQPPDHIVVGTGFTGLLYATLAVLKGESVLLYEKQNRSGGLIGSVPTPFGLVETAANGILNSYQLEELASALNLDIISDKKELEKKIYLEGRNSKKNSTFLFGTLTPVIRSFDNTCRDSTGGIGLPMGGSCFGKRYRGKFIGTGLRGSICRKFKGHVGRACVEKMGFFGRIAVEKYSVDDSKEKSGTKGSEAKKRNRKFSRRIGRIPKRDGSKNHIISEFQDLVLGRIPYSKFA